MCVGVLSSLVAQAGCCFGGAALNCFCGLFKSSTATRLGYSLQLVATALLAWLMLSYPFPP
jgi:hypothetical protein